MVGKKWSRLTGVRGSERSSISTSPNWRLRIRKSTRAIFVPVGNTLPCFLSGSLFAQRTRFPFLGKIQPGKLAAVLSCSLVVSEGGSFFVPEIAQANHLAPPPDAGMPTPGRLEPRNAYAP